MDLCGKVALNFLAFLLCRTANANVLTRPSIIGNLKLSNKKNQLNSPAILRSSDRFDQSKFIINGQSVFTFTHQHRDAALRCTLLAARDFSLLNYEVTHSEILDQNLLFRLEPNRHLQTMNA